MRTLVDGLLVLVLGAALLLLLLMGVDLATL